MSVRGWEDVASPWWPLVVLWVSLTVSVICGCVSLMMLGWPGTSSITSRQHGYRMSRCSVASTTGPPLPSSSSSLSLNKNSKYLPPPTSHPVLDADRNLYFVLQQRSQSEVWRNLQLMSLPAPPSFLVTTVARDSQTEIQLTGFQWWWWWCGWWWWWWCGWGITWSIILRLRQH